MPEGSPKLVERVGALSDELRAALRDALRPAWGGDAAELRPVHLTTELGLDKSLASRLVRTLGAKDALRALHRMPTPAGLGIVADAVERAWGRSDALEGLRAASARYAALLAEFGGGRGDLDAALAGWIPELRAQAERDARRAVVRGAGTLAGFRAGASYEALFLVPSTDAERVDALRLALRQDVRRLRDGLRLELAVVPHRAGEPTTALDGSALTGDPRALLVEELCSHPLPALEQREGDGSIAVAIAPDALDVNEFATVGLAWRTRGGRPPARATAERRWARFALAPALAAEALVVDVFVHHHVALRGGVFATLSGTTPSASAEPPAADAPERIRAPRVAPLDGHPSGLASMDVRSVAAITENVCREAGYAVGEFAPHRTRLAYPVPHEALTLWWEPAPA